MKKVWLLLSPTLLAAGALAEELPRPAGFEFTSGVPALDAAYQKARRTIAGDVKDGNFLAGQDWAQVWTRDTSYSVEMACALLHPDVSKKTLLGLREDVPGIGECWYQDKCGHFAGWPNLTDAIVGATGAWSLYLVTGDRELLRPVFDRTVRSLQRAERDAFFKDCGLFGGCSTFMESNSGYPKKYAMHGPMIAKTKALSTNLLYYRGYLVAARLAQLLGENPAPWQTKADALKAAINAKLWLPKKGYYAYFLDADGQLDERMEGCGEAFAILYRVADAKQAESILKKTPVAPCGFPCLWPQYPEWINIKNKKATADYYHNGMIWPFVEGYWAWAASQAKDVAVFDRELQALIKLSQNADTFMEFYFPENGEPGGSPRQLWSASGFLSMIYHGLFGMDFVENGISFAPVVPANLNKLTLTNVKYRNAVLAIEVTGHGTKLAKFALDGQATGPFLDATLTGSHTIQIQMAEQ
jgi:hypothetical protein